MKALSRRWRWNLGEVGPTSLTYGFPQAALSIAGEILCTTSLSLRPCIPLHQTQTAHVDYQRKTLCKGEILRGGGYKFVLHSAHNDHLEMLCITSFSLRPDSWTLKERQALYQYSLREPRKRVYRQDIVDFPFSSFCFSFNNSKRFFQKNAMFYLLRQIVV